MAQSGNERRFSHINAFIPLINSLLATGKLGITIIEITFLKEEIVIRTPPLESLEYELRVLEKFEDFRSGCRYFARGILSVDGRNVPFHVRFYIKQDGKLNIEDYAGEGTTLLEGEDFKKSELWKKIAERGEAWGPTVVELFLSYYGITT